MFFLNGTLNIFESSVYLPRNGAWTGDFWTDPPASGQPMAGPVTVALVQSVTEDERRQALRVDAQLGGAVRARQVEVVQVVESDIAGDGGREEPRYVVEVLGAQEIDAQVPQAH